MADIELVIKISEEKLSILKNKMYCGIYDPDLYNAIANGIPLPKGHGKLKDASSLLTVTDIRSDGSEFTYVPYSEIDDAPTIIEADQEELQDGCCGEED